MANDAGVSSHPGEATLDMLGSDGVKGTADVKKGHKAVGLPVYVTFNIVGKERCSSLRRSVTAEAVLLRVQGSEANTLVNMPENSRSSVLRR